MKQKIILYLNNLLKEANIRLKPVYAYWEKLSDREKQLVTILGGVIGLFILVSIFSSAISFRKALEARDMQLERYKMEALVMYKEYRDLSSISANQFSSANADQIKADISEVLDVKNPNVVVQDNVLSIDVDNADFKSIMLFLDQMRNSYGLFPDKLKITRLSKSGYASFSVTFILEG